MMPPIGRIFISVLVRQPVRAAEIAWWWLVRRRVRARLRLGDAAVRLPESYRLWRALYQPARFSGRALARLRHESWACPLVAVHLHLVAGRDTPRSAHALQSVLDQVFLNWELLITSPDPTTPDIPADGRIRVVNEAIRTRAGGLARAAIVARASHIVPLRADCTLTPGALFAYARAVAEFAPDEEVLFYADQDERGVHNKRQNPWFKPEWDEDMFLAQDYLSAACALPAAAIRRASADQTSLDSVAIYALIARMLLPPTSIAAKHVQYVTTTVPVGDWREPSSARFDLVRAIASNRFGALAEPGAFGTISVRRPLLEPQPQVSVIVPTRDRLDLLKPCIDGVLYQTDYANIEVIIADNGSVEPETLAYLDQCAADPRVTVVRWPHPYNFSAINNFAVSGASGTYICLLNNDTEVVDPAWLHALMGHAIRPEVGAVGARLLYADRSIQHAGVVVGMGGAAGHAHRGLPEGDPGYFAQTLVTRSATAVTAACLVVAKEKFDAVGGLDEDNFAIAYNDVDLCLKLRSRDWRNMYVSQAVLIHHESKSRGLDFAPEHRSRYEQELAKLQQRWGTVDFQDPMHHPALDRASETYRLRI